MTIYLLAAALVALIAAVVGLRFLLGLFLVRLDNKRRREVMPADPLLSYTPQTVDRFREDWMEHHGGAL